MASEDKWMALGIILSILSALGIWFLLGPDGFWQKGIALFVLGFVVFCGVAFTALVTSLREESDGGKK